MTHDEMVQALKAAGVLAFHGTEMDGELVPYPHDMPPGGVDLWRITEDPELLAAAPQSRMFPGMDAAGWERMYLTAAKRFGDVCEAVLTKAAEGGSLADVVELVADWMDGCDYIDDELVALHQRAKVAAEESPEGMSEDDLEHVCEALMEVGGWDEIDGDGTNASIIADHIRWLPGVLAERGAAAPQPRVLLSGHLAGFEPIEGGRVLLTVDGKPGDLDEPIRVGLMDGTRVVVIEDTPAPHGIGLDGRCADCEPVHGDTEAQGDG